MKFHQHSLCIVTLLFVNVLLSACAATPVSAPTAALWSVSYALFLVAWFFEDSAQP